MRAYGEINDFEAQLIEHNTVLVKFWLTITEEEQIETLQGARRDQLQNAPKSPQTIGVTAKNGTLTRPPCATW